MKIQWRRVPIRELPRTIIRGRILCAVVSAIPITIAFSLMPFLIIRLVQTNQMGIWFYIAMQILLVPLSWIWMSIVYGLFLRPEYYYRIHLEGYDVCLGCGYWLRGLDESIKKCPECGTERKTFGEDKQTKAGPV